MCRDRPTPGEGKHSGEVKLQVRAGGEDDEGGDGDGQEEDQEEEPVDHDGDLLPLQLVLFPAVGLQTPHLVLVNR